MSTVLLSLRSARAKRNDDLGHQILGFGMKISRSIERARFGCNCAEKEKCGSLYCGAFNGQSGFTRCGAWQNDQNDVQPL